MVSENVLSVTLGRVFAVHFSRLPQPDKEKILCFMRHVSQYGFSGLQGRNKPSHEVPTSDAQWLQKVQYAQKHNLWHYHIGIPEYQAGCVFGDCTSQFLLHYIRGNSFIKLVDFSEHPPFQLPSPDNLI